MALTEEQRARKRLAEKMRNLGKPYHVLPEEHAEALRRLTRARAHGMDDRMISEQVNLSAGTIYGVWSGRIERMHRDTYNAIMQIVPDTPQATQHPTRGRVPDGSRRDGTSTARRVRALRADGFPNNFLCTLAECSSEAVSELARVPRRYVYHTTWQLWSGIYEKLVDTDPRDHGVPSQAVQYTKVFAEKKGWAPSRCWDVDTIEDPAAFPEWTGVCGTYQGRGVHQRENIPICDPCRKAVAARQAELASYVFDRERLVMLMEYRGITVVEMAKRIDKGEETIRAWRSGRRRPKPEGLESLASALGVHSEELRKT